jgi:hypothetical protein
MFGAPFVDAAFVNDNRDKAAELDQRMPVAAIARQAGGLDREDRPAAALADRRQKALETTPVDATARAPEIIVDDLFPELGSKAAHVKQHFRDKLI